MASCADCKRIIFGKANVSKFFSGPVCQACINGEQRRSIAENETRVLEKLWTLPSPPNRLQADGIW